MKYLLVLLAGLALAGCGNVGGLNEAEGAPAIANNRFVSVSGTVVDFSAYATVGSNGRADGTSYFTNEAPVQIKQGGNDCLCKGASKLYSASVATVDCGSAVPACSALSGVWGVQWDGRAKATKLCHQVGTVLTCEDMVR